MRARTTSLHVAHPASANKQRLDDAGLRDVIQSQPISIGNEEFKLWLVGLSETANHAKLIAIAISGIDERLQLQLSDDLQRDPMALRQRIVYFAKRIVTAARPSNAERLFA